MMVRKISVLVILCVLCMACVKENRRGCPCVLKLDFSELDAEKTDSAFVEVVSAHGLEFSGVVYASEFNTEYIVKVPRRNLWVNAFYGIDRKRISEDGSLIIRRGDPSPKLYMYSKFVNADCELVKEKLNLLKNYAMVGIQVVDVSAFPFHFLVKGTIDGYSADGNPNNGDFVCKLMPDSNGYAEVAVPRQLDGSLVLEVADKTEIVKSFALGEYIIASGFDWTEPELKDISIAIDYARSKISISVASWVTEYVFDIEI